MKTKKLSDVEKFLESDDNEGYSEYRKVVFNSIVKSSIKCLISSAFISILLTFFKEYISPLVIIEVGSFGQTFIIVGIISFVMFLVFSIIQHRNILNPGDLDKQKNSLSPLYNFCNAYDLISFVITAIAIIYIVLMVVITPTSVIGSSMNPNFFENDKLLVYHLFYDEPQRGDVIVLDATNYVSSISFSTNEHEQELFIKRVVGLPGDIIKFEGESLYVNGEKYPESYIINPADQIGNYAHQTFVLGGDEYFIMGDNRTGFNSFDSRAFGPVKKDDILGKVILRIYPNISTF